MEPSLALMEIKLTCLCVKTYSSLYDRSFRFSGGEIYTLEAARDINGIKTNS